MDDLYQIYLFAFFVDGSSITSATTAIFSPSTSVVPPGPSHTITAAATPTGGMYTRSEVKAESSAGGAGATQKQSFPEVKKAIAKPPKKRKGKTDRISKLSTNSAFIFVTLLLPTTKL